MEFLTIHDYDGRIQNQQELRSMKNSKLVDFILHSLHNTIDYIESANILFATFEKIEQNYLNNFVIPTICDWLGQINLRRAIILRLNEKENSGIPFQILSLIPMIGPLHVSLNNLLDNSLPLTLEIYAKLFRCGFYKGYLKGIHPIIEILKNNLPIFNDYFVENFHSSLRYQTAESNTEKQIIQKAKIIDIERNDEEFKSVFVNTKSTKISKVKLISLEKKVSLILLLSLFNEIYYNIGKTKNNNNKTFELPSFNNKIVDIRVLPLA
ncbi:hypothetical protein RclHR1_08970003 [Rhizophagus clarus]|uniref:Uncharacterized protein n=1 Tax=Rhizophagus clarus TaxID=94130 RepID=A0A2Z6S8W8_9GLOM|nr:hypothetical protein RclHR1_08970003 [Rhizophagus clarus]